MTSISYVKHTLTNGLDVILHEDHSLPMVAVNVWYHVGSKDEEPGRTGFAHLFEHVMFEGSKHHNKSFFEPLQEAGANLNGSTSTDRTNYWEDVPSNYLELALWLEADRMGFLLDALDQKRFDIQRDVVKNERRQSYENRPYGMAHIVLQPAVYPSPHPYSWPTIGSQQDLDAATLEDIKGFFRQFYGPSTASVAIAGDFVGDEVIHMVERYFGELSPTPSPKRVGRMDSKLTGQISLTIRDKVQLPRLYLVWPSCALFSSDQAALDMLSVILGDGKSSRLYRSLVYEKQIARDVAVMQNSQEIAGEFYFQVTANPGHELKDLEKVFWDELDKIGASPPDEKELARAKNRIESQHMRQLQRFGGFGGRADELNYYNVLAGDPNAINTDLDRYMAITPEDIQRVAAGTLGQRYVSLSILPERRLRPSTTSLDRSIMPNPSAAPSFNAPIPVRLRLSNGLNVLFLQKDDLPLVGCAVLLQGGAVTDPPDRPGLAHITASMLQEGTLSRTSQQISEEMEFLGSQLEIDTGREHVLLSAEVLTSNWVAALDVIADVVRNPSFPCEELERVRKDLVTDLKRVADNPTAISNRASRALLYGPATRYGHPVTGTEQSIQAITRDEVLHHFSERYVLENATLIVVGAVTESDVISQAETCFGAWDTQPAPPPEKGISGVDLPAALTTIFLADKPDAAQSVIRAGHLTIPRLHSDYYSMSLLNYLFGGQFSARLNMNLRQDKGYSYGYTSSIAWHHSLSTLLAGGSVQTAVTRESVEETLKEFGDITDIRPVTEEEFDAARNGLLRGIPSQFATIGQTLSQLTGIVLFDLPEDSFAAYADNLRAVTLEDVRRVARDRIDRRHLSVLIVGDRQVIEPGLRELGLPIVPVDYGGNELAC